MSEPRNIPFGGSTTLVAAEAEPGAAERQSRPFLLRVWHRFKWFILGILLLFFGGLGAQGLTALMSLREFSLGWEFFWPLIVFSVGGGITIGLLILAWELAADRNPLARALGLTAFLILLFALFVWPTPYKYYRTRDLGLVVRINRITGEMLTCQRLADAEVRCFSSAQQP